MLMIWNVELGFFRLAFQQTGYNLISVRKTQEMKYTKKYTRINLGHKEVNQYSSKADQR